MRCNIGEVENDTEVMPFMKVLGENMTWLLLKLHYLPERSVEETAYE